MSSPLSDACHLLHNLILEIPGEDKYVIWFGLLNLFRRIDRDVRARQEFSLFVGIAIHCVVQKIGADAAVVQESVSLPRSPISRDGLSFALCFNEEIEQFSLGFF